SLARLPIQITFPSFAANSDNNPPNDLVSPNGNVAPVSPVLIMSGPQPTRSLTKQGTPQAIASLTTSPHVSPPSDGNTSASAATYAAVISDWLRKPANLIGRFP